MKKILQASLIFALVASGTYWALATGVGGPGISASPPAAVGSLTGLGTGVATALGINVGSAGAPVVQNGALGTPSSGVISNCTSTSMVLTTPVLGTPTSGTLTNCTIPMSAVTGGSNHAVATYGASGLGTGIAPSTSGNVLTSNGTDWVSSAASGGLNPSTTFEYLEEFFIVPTTATATGPMSLVRDISDTGQSLGRGTDEAGTLAFAHYLPGTNTASGVGFKDSNANTYVLGSGAMTYEARVRLVSLSDATNTYIARIGFGTSSQSDTANAVFFRYTHSVNTGKWVMVCRQGSTETATNTTATVAANTWTRLTIVVNAAASSVAFSVDGVSVGTVTTNIPTGAAQATGICGGLIKSAGATQPAIDFDYLYFKWVPTTPR